MIKEISWYLESGRFTGIAEELENSLKKYEEAKKAGSDEETLSPVREETRLILEDHCLRSGLRKEGNTYINIDAEFFDGSILDENTKDNFIKNILKGHCYQKVLWTYMGTTGTFTAISKNGMKTQGLKYEDYLPIEYKKKNPEKKPLADKTEKNEELFYIYGDGTVSKEYNREKAEIRFNRLEDRSGIDWNAGYDPNGSVKKDGWHGRFNHEGIWVRVENDDEAYQAERKSSTSIEIIKDGDTAILYDPGMLLLSAPLLMYFTEDGQPYGNLESDTARAAEEINAVLKKMGINRISAIGGVTDAGVIPAYREVLKEAAAENLKILDSAAVVQIKEAHLKEAELRASEENGIRLERKLRAAGKEASAAEAITLGSVTVKLSVRKTEDAVLLGLSEEEAKEVNTVPVRSENETAYDTILSNLFVSWYLYEGGFENKAEAARIVNEYLESPKDMSKHPAITAQASLEQIIQGVDEKHESKAELYSSGIPGVFGEPVIVDFYNEEAREKYVLSLEKKRVLPKGGAAAALGAVKTLPQVNEEKKILLSKGLTRALGQYKAISISCGLPLTELIDAVKEIIIGAKVNSPAGKRKVFYEVEMKDLVKEAGKENLQKKEKKLEDMIIIPSETIVIGGVKGTALDEADFTREKLTDEYGFSEKEAAEAEPFLHSVRYNGEGSSIPACIYEVMRSGKGKTPGELRHSILAALEKSGGVISYNLSSEAGLQAYMESSQAKESNVSREEIRELLEHEKKNSGSVIIPSTAVSRIEPKYKDTGEAVSFTRNTPRGTPEKIRSTSQKKSSRISIPDNDRVFPLDTVTLKSGGNSLDTAIVHVGSFANEIATNMNVLAFAYGNDIFFKNGAYRPESEEGRKLIAHELEHVAQYEAGKVNKKSDFKELEKEAVKAEAQAEYKHEPKVPYVVDKNEVYYLHKRDIAKVEAMVQNGIEKWIKEQKVIRENSNYIQLLQDYQEWQKNGYNTKLQEIKRKYANMAVKSIISRYPADNSFTAKDAEEAWKRALSDRSKPTNAVKVSGEEKKREKAVLAQHRVIPISFSTRPVTEGRNLKLILFKLQYSKEAERIGIVESGSNNISTTSVRFQWEMPLNNIQREGSSGNAFRHALWQAAITSEFSDEIARRAGNAHESGNTSITGLQDRTFSTPADADRATDLLNNVFGRSIGNLGRGKEMNELAKDVLRFQYMTGLYEAILQDNGAYRVEIIKISEDVFTQGMERLNQLNKYGCEE